MADDQDYGTPATLGFELADAEDVTLAYNGDRLLLHFKAWNEVRQAVAFWETVAFRWQRAEDVGPNEAFDAANEVTESAWLARHRAQQEASAEHRHLKLNFNAAGCLDVLCTRVEVTET